MSAISYVFAKVSLSLALELPIPLAVGWSTGMRSSLPCAVDNVFRIYRFSLTVEIHRGFIMYTSQRSIGLEPIYPS